MGSAFDQRLWCLGILSFMWMYLFLFRMVTVLCAKYSYQQWDVHGRMPPVWRRKELNDREADTRFIWKDDGSLERNETKESVGLGLVDISDTAFSKILLDKLVIFYLSASIIFIFSCISKRITKWYVLC